ncbi:MAG: sigma-70 family RNA polymerase sigma factor [Myxococcales bacterium]
MRNSSDEELLKRSQSGDSEALELLLGRLRDQIYRFGLKMCGDSEDAKDVLQETMLSVARNIGSFRGDSSLSTWLYRIAHSFCVKHRHKLRDRPPSLAASMLAETKPVDRPDDSLDQRELQAELTAAVHELEPMYREVLVLRDMEGLSAPEVAEVLGIGVPAVKSRLHRARLAVRNRLGAYLDTLPGPAVRTEPTPNCPDVLDLFSRHLEGDVPPDLCRQLEAHVGACASCRAKCDSLKKTLALCRSVPEAEVPAEIQASIREALHELRGTD